MVTEGQYIYCKDWNIRKRIVCSEKVIGKALGIRAHDIKVIKEREYADAKCVVEDVIESTFDMIYLLRPDGAKKPLRMQLPKSQVLVIMKRKKCIFLFGKRHFYFAAVIAESLRKNLSKKCTIPYNK